MQSNKKSGSLKIWEMAVFAMLGALMFCSKIVMEFLPNVHLLGALTMTYTIVFRKKALIPLYIYIALNGVFAGFAPWWWPYLYIWTILWGITMLLPKRMPKVVACVVYPVVCALHGFAFGLLYAPAQALMYGFGFRQMVAWIVAGIPFDVLQGVSNFIAGLLVFPLSQILFRLVKGKR